MTMDVAQIRRQFPVTDIEFDLPCTGQRRRLVYLDHGASTHPPREVLDKYRDFIEHSYANIHRGLHSLSMISTDLFEHVSQIIARFVRADLADQAVVYTQNTTEALDLCGHVMADVPGITLVTEMEHHSNDLPHRRRGDVRHVRVNASGCLDMAHLEAELKAHQVKLVAVTGGSNVTGFLPDLAAIARLAHQHGARILVDAAQILAHHPVTVGPAGSPDHIDFLAAAGHKAYAPFGSAFLLGPKALLAEAPPYRPGGGTIVYVTTERVGFLPTAERHQGGTPNIPGVIALACSLEFLERVGMEAIRAHELELVERCLERLTAIEGVDVLGDPDPRRRLGVVAFNVDGVHHSQVSSILNSEWAIATRNGCFCAHPYLYRLLDLHDVEHLIRSLAAGIAVEDQPGAVRASFGIYNTLGEVDLLVQAVQSIAQRQWVGEYEVQGFEYCKPEFYSFRFEDTDDCAPGRPAVV